MCDDLLRPTILLVDDDTIQLEFYEAVLNENYRTMTAASYHESIRLLTTKKVDAVISDYHLQGSHGGMDLLAWISECNPDLIGRTLVLSGDVQVSLGQYRVPLLLKPVDSSSLMESVTELLASASCREQSI